MSFASSALRRRRSLVSERHRLRATFEEVPELYDRARPSYPEALFGDLVALAGLAPGSRVLEIGCGTGKATVALAERALDVVCVELGPGLAGVARRNLAAFPNVQVLNAEFESWDAPTEPFDAVVAFTALHWIDADVRYAKTARLLRSGGALAFATAQTVLTEDGDPFWFEVQEDYDAVVPSDRNQPPPRPDGVDDDRAEIEASGLFRDVDVRRHVWEVEYTADEYIAVLETYSGHRSIEEEKRRELYRRIRQRIARRHDGRIRKNYLAILHVAKRR